MRLPQLCRGWMALTLAGLRLALVFGRSYIVFKLRQIWPKVVRLVGS